MIAFVSCIAVNVLDPDLLTVYRTIFEVDNFMSYGHYLDLNVDQYI